MMHLLRRLRYTISPLEWQCKAKSHIGPRDENQDNYLYVKPNGEANYLLSGEWATAKAVAWSGDFYRVAVADGMGGHLHGREVAEDLMQALLAFPAQSHFSPIQLREGLYRIHKQLLDKYHQTAGARKPGATLVIADVHRITGQVLLANVGDSRAFVWRKGCAVPEPLTWDHNNAEFDWREAVEEDPASPLPEQEKSNAVAQAMVFGSYGLIKRDGYRPRQLSASLRLDVAEDLPAVARDHADILSFFLNRGETLMLATDGLWSGDGFTWPAPPSPASAAELSSYLEGLIEQAVANNGKDNVTVVALGCY